MAKRFIGLWLLICLSLGFAAQIGDNPTTAEYIGFIQGTDLVILDLSDPTAPAQTIKGDIYAFCWMKQGYGLYYTSLNGENLELRKLPSVGAESILIRAIAVDPGDLNQDSPIQRRVSLNCLSNNDLVMRLELGGWVLPDDIQDYYYATSLNKLTEIDYERYLELKKKSDPDNVSDRFVIENRYIKGIYELYKVEYITDRNTGTKTKNQTRLTYTEGLERYLEEPVEISWDLSPKGEMLVYYVITDYGDMAHGVTYLINIDGSKELELPGDHAWRNNGDLLYVTTQEYDDGSEYGGTRSTLSRIDTSRKSTKLYEVDGSISDIQVKK